MMLIHKPIGRFCIAHNGQDGPIANYKSVAFWPNRENPELIGVTEFFGKEQIWSVKQAEQFATVDESLSNV